MQDGQHASQVAKQGDTLRKHDQIKKNTTTLPMHKFVSYK